jgi:RNA polymerase sigma factor (sigma-70 family)
MIAFITSTLSDPEDRDYMLWIYHEYHRLMFAEARKYFKQQGDCEDVVQEGLLKLCNKVSTIRGKPRYAIASYIVAVIRNTSFTILKKRKRQDQRMVSLDTGLMDDVASDDPPLYEVLAQFEEYSQLYQIWNDLSEHDRFLLEGKYILQLENAELAASLGCQPDSIRMMLSRARKNALHLLNNLDKEGAQ